MSTVEVINSAVSWTISDVSSEQVTVSEPFIASLNGQDVTFTLRAVCLPTFWSKPRNQSNTVRSDGSHGYPHRLVIYVKSSRPITWVPKLDLLANDGEWHDLAVESNGPNSGEMMFFGSTDFVNNAKRSNYLPVVSNTIRFSLPESVVKSLKRLGEISISDEHKRFKRV